MNILLSFNLRVILTFLLIILIFIALHVKYNRKNEMTVVERIGRFHRLIDSPSLFILIPFIDRVLQRIPTKPITESRRYTYQLNHEEIKKVLTIEYTVFDPKLYSYASIDPIASISDLISTAKENHFSDTEIFDQVKSYGRDLGITVLKLNLE